MRKKMNVREEEGEPDHGFYQQIYQGIFPGHELVVVI